MLDLVFTLIPLAYLGSPWQVKDFRRSGRLQSFIGCNPNEVMEALLRLFRGSGEE